MSWFDLNIKSNKHSHMFIGHINGVRIYIWSNRLTKTLADHNAYPVI